MRPTYHATLKPLKITTSITNNFEMGIYLFTNSIPGYGLQVVGTHIHSCITAHLAWKLPVGLSMSAKISSQTNCRKKDKLEAKNRPF